MAYSNTTLLGLNQPTTGQESGVWGDDVNNGFTQLVDLSVAGTNNITYDGDVTLSVSNGYSGSSFSSTTTTSSSTAISQYMKLLCTGSRTALRYINAPNSSKMYIIANLTTGGFPIVLRGVTGPTTGITIAPGEKVIAYWNTVTSDFTRVTSLDGLTTVTAAGTTTSLVSGSPRSYIVNGSGGQTFQFPAATSLAYGTQYSFNNNQSSGTIVVKNASGTTIVTVQSGAFSNVILTDNTTSAGTWDYHNAVPSNASWSTNTLTWAGSYSSGTWNGNVITGTYGGTGVNNGSNTITVAGNISFAGAFTQSFTASANTAVTLPAGATASTNNLLSSATAVAIVTGTPSSTTYLRGDGTWATIGATSGTVTSVAMTVPSFLSVSGSPITSSGTLAVTLSGTALPIANGGTGSTSTTFVNLASNVTGTLPIANGGTNSTATPTSGGVGYGTGSAHAYTSAGSSGQVLTSSGSGAPSWTTIGASGLVKISTTSITTNYQSISFSGYTRYLFVFDNLTTNVSVPNITFNSLGSGYQYGVISTGNNTYQYAASATSSVIYLTPFTLSTYQTFSGYMFLQTSNTYEAYVLYMISTSSSNGSVGNGNCATGGTTVTSIQIGGNNGTTGTVTIYGMS